MSTTNTSSILSEPKDTAAASATAAMPGFDDHSAEAIYVAPDWKLVWWRFKKHRLALISGIVIIFIATIGLFPNFYSTLLPQESDQFRAFIPPQQLHFFGEDGTFLYVYDVVGQRNPKTLMMEWVPDEKVIVPVKLWAQGYEYKLFGLITTSTHLFGVEDPASGQKFHLLGTDRLGRDQWSRLMAGTRVSLSIGLVSVLMSIFLGVLLGGISGYFGGWIDLVIQRLIELLQSLPAIPIWMALTAALPRDWSVEQTYFAITLILALIGWTTLAREVRGRFLSLREEDFVVAAMLIGATRPRIIFRHMVPTFSSHIIAASTLAIPVMIISETFLSFLGLGLRPPAISWGVLLQEAQNLQSVALAPWLLLPGLMVIITVLTLNILGDGLRDAADPYS
jgi:peptide/nickel transport system permease protein